MRPTPDHDRGRAIINFGLAAVVILLILLLIDSIFEVFSQNSGAGSYLRDPEVVALAVGLILTVLFVDRWRSLESKLDGLSEEQRSRLNDIHKFSTDQIQLKVDQVVDKAEKVSAKLAALSEQHPWLQVITERDIVVETESVRGILRTSYMLLKEDRPLQLYEFLEYCSRKGTLEDPRNPKLPLRGTADDFFEAACFCETWLEDYALAAQFLKRYMEQAVESAYVAYPDYVRRLLRIGSYPDAQRYAEGIERILFRDRWMRRIPLLRNATPVSKRYQWHAANALSLAHAAFGDARVSARYAECAEESSYASLFANQQILFNAERQIYLGEIYSAKKSLSDVNRNGATSFVLRDEMLLRERLGLPATDLRQLLLARQMTAYGDHTIAPTLPGDQSPREKEAIVPHQISRSGQPMRTPDPGRTSETPGHERAEGAPDGGIAR